MRRLLHFLFLTKTTRLGRLFPVGRSEKTVDEAFWFWLFFSLIVRLVLHEALRICRVSSILVAIVVVVVFLAHAVVE